MTKWIIAFILTLTCATTLIADQTTAFRKAVEKNDLAAVKKLLDKKPYLVHVDDLTGGPWQNPGDNYLPALHSAAYDGHLEMVNLLLARGALINLGNHTNSTPLHIAAMEGRVEVASLLISKGAKVNIRNDDDYTPLWCAVDANSQPLAKLLIDNGAKINVTIIDGMTVLNLAAQNGNLEICRLLVENGAKVDGEGKLTPLQCACDAGKLDTAQYLIDNKADANATCGNSTPLSSAINLDQHELAKLLITKGANVNTRNDSGYTLLQRAVVKGDPKLVKLLIENGADINAKLPDKPAATSNTPLQLALQLKNNDITDLLRKHGAME